MIERYIDEYVPVLQINLSRVLNAPHMFRLCVLVLDDFHLNKYTAITFDQGGKIIRLLYQDPRSWSLLLVGR